LASQEPKSSTAKDLSNKLELVMKRLETLEAIVLENPEYAELATLLRLTKASVGLYADPLKMVADSQSAKSDLKANVRAKLILGSKKVNVGEDVILDVQVANEGEAPAFLMRVEGIVTAGFELVDKPNYSRFEGGDFDMNRKRLDPRITEEIRLTLRSFDKGTYEIKPKIIYTDATATQIAFQLEPVTVNIVKTVLPGRISTGYNDLDSLLLGGIPENYAVILTSPSCDEKDLLIRRFLEAGPKKAQITFHVTIEASGVKTLAEENQSIFHLFICNPQADKIIQNLPNVFRLKGVENLTDISIALAKAFRRLDTSTSGPRRACIELVSDVLLQHGAVKTRRWLADVISELKSQGFATLAVMNPKMHSSQEVHAILGLFDGEINIYEKESKKGLQRFLKIKKMYNQRYLESELRLRKQRLKE